MVINKLSLISSKVFKYFIGYSLIFFFALEIINGLHFYSNPEIALSISWYVKLFWELIVVGYLLFDNNKEVKKEFIIIVFGFIGTAVLIVSQNPNLNLIIWDLKHLNKFFFTVIIFLFIKRIGGINDFVLKVFSWLIYSNTILIIIGLIFNVELFKTYPFYGRFGYSGVFSQFAVNEVTFFYIIANFFLYFEFKNQKISFWIFLAVFLSSFLLGTKAIILGNGILLIFIVSQLKEYRKLLIASSFIVLGAIIWLYDFSFWVSYYQEHGIVSVITSGRSEYIQSIVKDITQDWTFANYLFGKPVSTVRLTEMDMIDLFYFLGIWGSLFYFLIVFRNLFNFKKKNILAWTFVLCFFVVGGLSGHFFASGVNALYLALFTLYLQKHGKKPVNVPVTENLAS